MVHAGTCVCPAGRTSGLIAPLVRKATCDEIVCIKIDGAVFLIRRELHIEWRGTGCRRCGKRYRNWSGSPTHLRDLRAGQRSGDAKRREALLFLEFDNVLLRGLAEVARDDVILVQIVVVRQEDLEFGYLSPCCGIAASSL